MFSQLISLVIVMLRYRAILTGACKRKRPLSIPTFQLFMSTEKKQCLSFSGLSLTFEDSWEIENGSGEFEFPSSQCIEILQNEVRAWALRTSCFK